MNREENDRDIETKLAAISFIVIFLLIGIIGIITVVNNN